MDTYILLQHYWWFLISLLGALLVFLLFVQGGQGLLYTIGKTEEERNMIVNSLGRKWELTFTTLVTFGGAFFASFPLFYSTSFGGAFYVWMLILFVFVIQAVAYEFRRKPDNFLGEKSYNAFLIINGVAGAFLLGAAVGTLFTGRQFYGRPHESGQLRRSEHYFAMDQLMARAGCVGRLPKLGIGVLGALPVTNPGPAIFHERHR